MAGTTESVRPRVGRTGAIDRISVWLFAVGAFLVVLAMLITQLHVAPSKPRVVVVRRVYRTTVVETVLGQRAGGTTVSRSTTGAGSAPVAPAAPTTRVS